MLACGSSRRRDTASIDRRVFTIAARKENTISHFLVILLLLWTGLAAASLWWNMVDLEEAILKTARIQANLILDKDLLYRRWLTSHGGVYVPVSEKTPPNHYLNVPDRDVKTPTGQTLTLMDHAYMTRQVNEMAEETGSSHGRLASLFSYGPANNPDSWEARALQAFREGRKEAYELEKIDGADHMRLMRPFVAEQSCMKCHAWQGYTVGATVGGISVSIDMKPFYTLLETDRKRLLLIHGIVWLFFIALIALGGKRLQGAHAELRDSEHRFRELFNNMKSGVAVYDARDGGEDFVITDFNRAAEKIEQISKADVVGKSVLQVFPVVKEFGLFDVLQNVWRDGVPRQHPVSLYKDDRIEGWRENYLIKLFSGEVVAIYDDVTEMKKQEEEIRTLSITDPLTGLYNRRGFMALAAQQIKAAIRTKNKLLMLFIDLDGMKRINDAFGHEAGDQALLGAVTCLKQTFRESDILARMGGDEFAVLAVDSTETREIVVQRLAERVTLNNTLSDSRYEISMSMGAAVYDPQAPCSLDELISRADTLMYQQKETKSGNTLKTGR
jgi:diguanylate cyclase (GGDEF)-like protein